MNQQELRQNFSQAAQSLTKLFNSANQQYKEAYAKGQKDMIKEIVQFCLAENNNLKTIELEKLEVFLEAKLSTLNQKPAMQQQQPFHDNTSGTQQKDKYNMQNRGIELEGLPSSHNKNQYGVGNNQQFNNPSFIQQQGQNYEQQSISQNRFIQNEKQYMQQESIASMGVPPWNQQQDQSMGSNQTESNNNNRIIYCVKGMKSQND